MLTLWKYSPRSLASSYHATGRYQEAAVLHKANWRHCSGYWGPGTPTLASRYRLAAAHRAAGGDTDSEARSS